MGILDFLRRKKRGPLVSIDADAETTINITPKIKTEIDRKPYAKKKTRASVKKSTKKKTAAKTKRPKTRKK